jgi:hypothetical protein
MRKVFVLTALLLACGLLLAAEEWHGYLIDTMCAAKLKNDKDKVAAHKTKCAIGCSKSGYGIVTSDGKFVKFDEAGNAKALEALKAASKDQDLTAMVTGELEGDRIKVESVTIH